MNELQEPLLFRQLILFLTLLNLHAGYHKSPYVGQRRNTKRAVTINKLCMLRLLKAETTHARVVIDTNEVIKRRKLTYRAFLFRSKNLFATVKQ